MASEAKPFGFNFFIIEGHLKFEFYKMFRDGIAAGMDLDGHLPSIHDAYQELYKKQIRQLCELADTDEDEVSL